MSFLPKSACLEHGEPLPGRCDGFLANERQLDDSGKGKLKTNRKSTNRLGYSRKSYLQHLVLIQTRQEVHRKAEKNQAPRKGAP